MARVDVLLLADGGDTAGGEAGGAGADELGKPTDHLQLGGGGLDAEVALDELLGVLEVLVRVFFDGGQDGGVEEVGLAQVGGVLVAEDEAGFVVDDVEEGETEDLAQVQTGGHLFEGLLAWARGLAVDGVVVFGEGEHDVLIVEGAVFAVDGHGHVRGEVQVGDFGHRADVLHVGGVDARAEDAANLHLAVSVRGGDEGSGCVVDQRGDLDGQVLFDVSKTILDWLSRKEAVPSSSRPSPT